MMPHHRLTIILSWHRCRELREFRDLVEDYYARLERDSAGEPMDWEGARVARSAINRMLPRILQVVRAAGLEGAASAHLITDPGPALGQVDVLQRIFSPRYGDGAEQELFDLLDMAQGVYDSGWVMALARTVNPLHYAAVLLGFIGRAPRRLLTTLGWRRSGPTPGSLADPARLEAALTRLGNVEELIETRFAHLQDRQGSRLSNQAQQVAELAERVDFAERMLAQARPAERLPTPRRMEPATPV